MGSYYKHTKTESIDVPYSFRCEQCMEDSGPLKAVISGNPAEINSNFKNLDAGKQQQLAVMAHEKLVRAVKDAHRDATEKHIYHKAFADKCPHCGKPQSWAVSGAQKGMFTNPLVSLFVGLIVAVMCYFFVEDDFGVMVAVGAAALGAIVGLILLIINFVKVSAKKRQTAAALQQNEPEIDWRAVQHILNEP